MKNSSYSNAKCFIWLFLICYLPTVTHDHLNKFTSTVTLLSSISMRDTAFPISLIRKCFLETFFVITNYLFFSIKYHSTFIIKLIWERQRVFIFEKVKTFGLWIHYSPGLLFYTHWEKTPGCYGLIKIIHVTKFPKSYFKMKRL